MEEEIKKMQEQINKMDEKINKIAKLFNEKLKKIEEEMKKQIDFEILKLKDDIYEGRIKLRERARKTKKEVKNEKEIDDFEKLFNEL
jgi:peptidoglycan hydrolase CwlO-like protein